MEKRRSLAWFAAGAGLVAAALWLSLLAGAGGNAPPPSAADGALADVLARLEAVEARVEALEVPQPAVAPSLERAPVPHHLTELERRLEALERAGAARTPARAAAHEAALLQAETAGAGVPAPHDRGLPLERVGQRAVVDAARARILDPAAPETAKVEAHGALRGIADAYTDAMVQELVRIGFASRDGLARADVWRFFDGESKPPAIVGPLLHAVANDTEGAAREEAAETLGNYRGQPGVDDALRRAAEHDPDERVRAKARRTLGLGDHDALRNPRAR